jgi:3-deoxy-D-manno-octulosonic-acid transferase
VAVAGNLKYAIRPPQAAIVPQLRAILDQSAAGPILVAGSTMPGEEKFLLAVFRELAQEFPRLWMILAPRHPERFEAVAEEIRAAGIPLLRRSELSPSAALQSAPATKTELPGVLLLDSTGELGSVYELATGAFVGGTLVPTGGHNILEPACFAKPIVIGPSMTNFQEIADAFLEANPSRDREGTGPTVIPGVARARIGAVVQIPDAGALAPALRFIFNNPGVRELWGGAARRLLENRLNPTDRILRELERLMGSKTAANGEPVELPARAMVEARPWQGAEK